MSEPLRGYSMPFDKRYNKFIRLTQIYKNYLEVQKTNLKTYKPYTKKTYNPLRNLYIREPEQVVKEVEPIKIEPAKPKPEPIITPPIVKEVYKQSTGIEWLLNHIRDQVMEAGRRNAYYLYVSLSIVEGWTIDDVNALMNVGYKISDIEIRYKLLEFKIKVYGIQIVD